MTAEERIKLVPRVVELLRLEIERNGNVYDGRMVPNLTSISDLCTAPSALIETAEASVADLERQRGIA